MTPTTCLGFIWMICLLVPVLLWCGCACVWENIASGLSVVATLQVLVVDEKGDTSGAVALNTSCIENRLKWKSFVVFAVTVKLFWWNGLCNRLWPYKTTVQPQMFSSELQFSFVTMKLSHLEQLQYTVVHGDIYSHTWWNCQPSVNED